MKIMDLAVTFNYICDPCKTAANIITNGSPALRDMKKRGHTRCVGKGQCDCQHRVGK